MSLYGNKNPLYRETFQANEKRREKYRAALVNVKYQPLVQKKVRELIPTVGREKLVDWIDRTFSDLDDAKTIYDGLIEFEAEMFAPVLQ